MAILDDLAKAQGKATGYTTPGKTMTTPGDVAAASNAKYNPVASAAPIKKTPVLGSGRSEGEPVIPPVAPAVVPPADVPPQGGKVPETGRTLARDTFISTFGLIFGNKEASQPYISKLYELVSGFYKDGATIDESLNLALYKAKNENVIPEYTSRFKGVFALRDKLNSGMAVTVPTIAEFFAAEAKMGEILISAGLGDLATQTFLGDQIGKGRSVLEVGNLISNVFARIDDAPTALKNDLSTYFPGVDRASIAKAILTGDAGAQELTKKINSISVLSAANTQGIKGLDLAGATDISKQGYDYQQSLTGFGQVRNLRRANELASITGGSFTQQNAMDAVFGKNIEQQNAIERIKQEELARYGGSPGNARGAFSTGYLNKSSTAGQI
jgi:hypothetical protein